MLNGHNKKDCTAEDHQPLDKDSTTQKNTVAEELFFESSRCERFGFNVGNRVSTSVIIG